LLILFDSKVLKSKIENKLEIGPAQHPPHPPTSQTEMSGLLLGSWKNQKGVFWMCWICCGMWYEWYLTVSLKKMGKRVIGITDKVDKK
jgi:hypothetical protein